MSDQPSKGTVNPSEKAGRDSSADDSEVKHLDKHFSQDVQQLANLERTTTLKAIAADQAAVKELIDADRRSPRNSPAPPQLQRMEHSMSEEELKKLDLSAQKDAAKMQQYRSEQGEKKKSE